MLDKRSEVDGKVVRRCTNSSFLQIPESLLCRREVPFVQRAESELMSRIYFKKLLVQHKKHLYLIKACLVVEVVNFPSF